MSHGPKNKKRIAIISPNREISLFFEWEAIACGCFVQVFSVPPEDTSSFDLIILDLEAGYCFAQNDHCQIVALSTNSSSKVSNSASIADLFWEWPVSIQTVRTVYDQIDTPRLSSPVVVHPSNEPMLCLISEQRVVVYRNQTITLTDREWTVLKCLAEFPNQPVSREMLALRLDGSQGNLVDVHICHLRKKLETPFSVRLIHTVRQRGYCLSATVKYL